MTDQLVQIKEENGIVTLTLNRPEKHNALNGQFVKDLLQALKKVADDPKTAVLIIHANGKNFCAGADISWMQEIANCSNEENEADAQMLADVMYQLYSFPKPTIVLVHGITLGGGLGLLSASDIAIAAKSSSFEFSEVKIGLIPAIISPYVIAAIGARMSRYYFLTANRFDVNEAHRLGLVHYIVEDELLLSTGVGIAKRLLLNSPNALKIVKTFLPQITGEKINKELVQRTAQEFSRLRLSSEAKEGLKAFIEKRDPQWRKR